LVEDRAPVIEETREGAVKRSNDIGAVGSGDDDRAVGIARIGEGVVENDRRAVG
jgi:hypothetical protein